MQRFAPYLGIVAALAFFMFVMEFANGVFISKSPAAKIATASSTLSVVPGFTVPTIVLPSLEPAATSSATTTTPTPKKVIPPVPKKTTPTPTPTPVPVVVPVPVSASTSPPLAPTGNAALDASASILRAALVNIICYMPAGSRLHSISGSGVFIDAKGIILTNAHIAQYFLLADRGANCVVRTGSPAADSYVAALVYIPSKWLRANADVLTQAAPSGTGEYDFALLAVNKSATRNALPASFPSIPLATIPPNTGTPVVIASYGAQFLESNQIQSGLFPTIVFGSIKDVFTFATNTIDVLALGGSAAAQEGSSGGGVADASSELVGTITTSTVTGATDTRSLGAITASYIRAEYAGEMGSALDLLLDQPIATSIAWFSQQMPVLETIITTQLP